MEKHFRRGIEHIRATSDRKKLRNELERTLASLRRDAPATARVRKAKTLALSGFASTLKGVESLLDFYENDSGNLPIATRDALRASRALGRGATQLRAAGRVLGVRVGQLNGY